MCDQMILASILFVWLSPITVYSHIEIRVSASFLTKLYNLEASIELFFKFNVIFWS